MHLNKSTTIKMFSLKRGHKLKIIWKCVVVKADMGNKAPTVSPYLQDFA